MPKGQKRKFRTPEGIINQIYCRDDGFIKNQNKKKQKKKKKKKPNGGGGEHLIKTERMLSID